jgi:hypothetical protein
VRPCVAKAKWELLETTPALPPRSGHKVVAVGNSVFVAGGVSSSNARLGDLWRMDVETLTWTELKPKTKERRIKGQSALLGPFGLLAYGGVEPGGHTKNGYDMWMFDFITDTWMTVPIAQTSEMPNHRYMSSIGLLAENMIMFGGDGRLLSNAYQNSYGFTSNSFFDDLWILSLGSPNKASGAKAASQCKLNNNHKASIVK